MNLELLHLCDSLFPIGAFAYSDGLEAAAAVRPKPDTTTGGDGLRDWIGRRRPPLVYPEPKPLVQVPHSGAFPSGHAAMAFACATVLAWWDRRLAVPAFVLAAAIGWSRVYVGVHWPLDVVGGALLGLGIGYALVLLGRRWRFGAGGDSAW